jgi:hypothetical protein
MLCTILFTLMRSSCTNIRRMQCCNCVALLVNCYSISCALHTYVSYKQECVEHIELAMSILKSSGDRSASTRTANSSHRNSSSSSAREADRLSAIDSGAAAVTLLAARTAWQLQRPVGASQPPTDAAAEAVLEALSQQPLRKHAAEAASAAQRGLSTACMVALAAGGDWSAARHHAVPLLQKLLFSGLATAANGYCVTGRVNDRADVGADVSADVVWAVKLVQLLGSCDVRQLPSVQRSELLAYANYVGALGALDAG